jgi:hypothetical protein
MFKFFKKANPALTFPALLEKMDNILKLDNVAEKTEQLLSLKETLKDKKEKEKNASFKRGILSTVGIGALACVMSLVPVIGTAVAITLMITMAVNTFAITASSDKASAKVTTMEEKINKEMTALIDSHPQEVVNSPQFRQSIKAGFNYYADVEEKFVKLTADVAQKQSAALTKALNKTLNNG